MKDNLRYKLINKLNRLNLYLQKDMEKAKKTKEFWFVQLNERGANTCINENVDKNLTYSKIYESTIERISAYEEQIKENKEIIKNLMNK